MKKIVKFLNDYDQSIGIIVIVILIYLFVKYKNTNVENEGRITIAKVTKFEGAESGVLLFLEISFNNKKYQTYVDVWCQRCVGKYFFVKVSRDEPNDYPLFYEDKPVPECILSKPLPPGGWKEIPVCGDDM